MIRTFLLAPLLLTRTVYSLQDFTGIGTVRCPVAAVAAAAAAAADNTADNGVATATSSACEFSYASPGGLIACVLDCPEAASFTAASFLMDAEETYLPCDCTQAINCPDACTFTAGAATSSGGIFNTTTTFQGAGRLTCPVDEYFAAPCIPLAEDCVGTGLVTCVATALSTLNVTNTTISIDVSCDCVTLADCSAECSFEPMMTTTTQSVMANATTGPGTLLCPSIDYAFHPCTLNVTQDDCKCEPTDFWRDSLLEFAVSLPCDCAIATNCPQSCEFTTDVFTDELNTRSRPDFTGPGIVTCSTEDYIASPCRINFFNIFDCITQAEECLSASLKNPDDIANITDSQVAIALPCFCMTLSDCPDSCTFTNSNNEEAMPSSPTAIITAPAPAATTTTNTAPSLPPTASPVDVSLAQNNNNTMITPTAPAPMLPTAGSAPIVQPPVVGAQQELESGSTSLIAAGAFWTTTLSLFLLTMVG